MSEPTDHRPTGSGPAADRASDADRVTDADRSEAVPRQRSAWTVAGVVAVLAIALLATAYVPRTVATGGEGEQSWRVTVTPGLVSPSLRLVGDDGTDHRAGGFAPRPTLDTTRIWAAPPDAVGNPVTVVVGFTPSGTDSVRVTSDARGVGEASVRRVAWRRVHVAVIEADAFVEELVAISEDGRVLDTVSDLGAPAGR